TGRRATRRRALSSRHYTGAGLNAPGSPPRRKAADLSRNRPGPSYTSASVPPGIRCLRRHKGEEYGRTPYRAEIPVRGRTRSRRLLVVPLRGLEKPAVLRRHAQGQRVRAREIRGGQGRKALAVRLQAHPQPAFLRRQPQEALGGRSTPVFLRLPSQKGG